MFKTLRTVLCAGLAVAASLGVAQVQAQTKIKYGAYHTANETFIKEITQMMDTITERTDGEVVFEPSSPITRAVCSRRRICILA